MSKFYLPTSTPASTTNPSPAASPRTLSIDTKTANLHSPHPSTSIAHHASHPSSPSASASDSETDDLPYPLPLPRSAFLNPSFTPQTYLSTLHNRHQTLEDLRADLRARSQLLSRELLDLVNANYEGFLTLGHTLHGGDERVEGVRVGVLGFKREVEGVREVVGRREGEVGRLLGERRRVRGEVVLGRKLLDVEGRVDGLEERLMLGGSAAGKGEEGRGEVDSSDEDVSSDDDDSDADDATRALRGQFARLRRSVGEYALLRDAMTRIGEHPFLDTLESRVRRIRSTLLLDLKAVLKQSRTLGTSGGGLVLSVVGLYRDMGEVEEGVKALKGR